MPFVRPNNTWCRSQRLRGQRGGSAAARLLELRVRIPTEVWMCVSYECCVLSGRDLCQADHSSRGVRLSVVCQNESDNEALDEEALAN